MKKYILLGICLLVGIASNSQTWSACGAGVTDPVNQLHVYSGNLYITDYTNPNPGNIDRWNGTTMTNVYNSIYQYGDLAASGSTIYTTGLSTGQGLYNSPTGNVGTWTQVGTNLGGPFQLCWFNSQLYRSNMSAASVQRLVGTTWTNVPLTYASAVGTPEIKTQGSLLYLGGRWNLGATYYGFTTINTSNVQAAYGPTITSGQTVTDFVFNGSDLYACINGAGPSGGFFKQNGSTWTTILSGYSTPIGRCEVYGGKLYFTGGSTPTIYCYDPTQVLSATNPSIIATISAGGVTDIQAYNGSLYFGGSFTNVNTVSMGVVPANKIIRMTVTLPVASFTTSPGSLCGLGTMTTNNTSTGATSYQWYVNGTPYSTSTNTTVNAATYTSPNPFVAGTFTVCLTAINGPARDSVTQVINTLANPTPPTVSALGSTTFCMGGNVTLQCSASPNYSWSSGQTTSTISATTTGTYSCNAVAVNGCSTPSTNSITVTVYSNPTASITASGPTTFCAGDSVTLTGSGATNYSWSPTGSTNSTISVSSSGVYTLTVTDTNGCVGTANQTVTVNPLPTPTVTQVGADLTTGTFSTYQWLLNGSVIPTATSQTWTPTSNGNYQVIVTNASGCTDTSAVFVWVSTGINELSNGQDFSVIKKDGVIHVTLAKTERVEVYDLLGNLVYSHTEQYHAIQVTPGVYLVRNKSFVKKVGL